MSISFLKVLKSEILKTKNTYGFLISLAGPVLIVGLVFFYYIWKHEDLVDSAINPWINFSRYVFNFYMFLYPLYAALIAFLISNIEHKNSGFKNIFTLPAPKLHFYFSKLSILTFWLFSSLLLGAGLLFLGANLLKVMYPELGFQNYNLEAIILSFHAKLFLNCLCILAIHFFLSLYWDNFIISVGSGCFLVILGMIAARWDKSFLIPYSHSNHIFIDFFNGSTHIFTLDILIGLAYMVLFFIGGYVLMARKEIF